MSWNASQELFFNASEVQCLQQAVAPAAGRQASSRLPPASQERHLFRLPSAFSLQPLLFCGRGRQKLHGVKVEGNQERTWVPVLGPESSGSVPAQSTMGGRAGKESKLENGLPWFPALGVAPVRRASRLHLSAPLQLSRAAAAAAEFAGSRLYLPATLQPKAFMWFLLSRTTCSGPKKKKKKSRSGQTNLLLSVYLSYCLFIYLLSAVGLGLSGHHGLPVSFCSCFCRLAHSHVTACCSGPYILTTEVDIFNWHPHYIKGLLSLWALFSLAKHFSPLF